jgi:hypothetical protein
MHFDALLRSSSDDETNLVLPLINGHTHQN